VENWQKNVFDAIDMQKRLDSLSKLRKQQAKRDKVRHRATRKRKAFVRPKLKRKKSLKKNESKTAGKHDSNKNKSAKTAGIVREPAKLQRCLQTAGYFKGVITGRLDDATLLSYLAFREDKKLLHRPNNLYDPVIQKTLFALCPDNSLSKLNQIVTNALGKTPTFVKAVRGTPANKMGVMKTAMKKNVREKQSRKGVDSNAPVTTASIRPVQKNNKKQARLPGAGKKDSASEEAFAKDVLAATRQPFGNVLAKGKTQRLASLGSTISSRSSSFAMKRGSASNKKLPPPAMSTKVASIARVGSSLYSKRLSISDLAMVQPVNPNTCSPQTHEPAVAMSSSPVMSSARPASSVRIARAFDDGPVVTGAIGPSSSRSPLRKSLKKRSRLVQTVSNEKACLPQDLYDLLAATHGRKTDVSVCKPDCLPAPGSFSQGQKELFAKQYKIKWCGTGCLGIADPLALQEVMKIEREARVHVCMTPQRRLTSAVKNDLDVDGINQLIRSLYDRLPGGYGNENNIAVIIGNRNYGRDIRVNDAGHVNAAAMKALLIEQLGYRKSNVIVVKDARLDDFVRLFGRRGDVRGELQRRLKANPDAQLMVYYSGHASSSGLGMNNYLLPVDAIAGIEDKTAYSLGVLYDNLRELDARTTQLFLEAGFNADRRSVVLAPNIAERRVNVAPIVPVRGLAVFTAATGDQKVLIDHETGIGLFTRYLISGLAGKADERPIGNGDRIIDSVELYVHLASNVRLAARKTLGLLQNPTLSRSDNLFLSQLSRKPRR
jgi:hypothetical protein